MNRISDKKTTNPSIFKAVIELNETKDTHIDVKNYQKGYVWVNGRNLGRYWNRGPQFRLYCPGVWLKIGKN
jgi:beta-galactosidase